ncbi:hypothetical protein Plim_4010 [Planctopirus limnophila DSM 3776]|uniref:Uncharacterized protein n=2 Tax=Planctopirus limnophila TaxID=120 RepID=D5SY28_PLAL2|nr:hypothetical protein Plim_4010 [Planctopirus limnophila DSM 3776]
MWESANYTIEVSQVPSPSSQVVGVELEETVYRKVCRIDHGEPGFCVIHLGSDIESQALRGFQVILKNQLARIHRERVAKDFVCWSAGRFDQQESTKLHRDGGPNESLLVLGYEPSEVRSQLAMADFSKCAVDLGITPAEVLERFNPMFMPGEEKLSPYTTALTSFDPARPQIVVINNSVAALGSGSLQGVLHTATIPSPLPHHRRVINSMMLASVPLGTAPQVSEEALRDFVTTQDVKRRY